MPVTGIACDNCELPVAVAVRLWSIVWFGEKSCNARVMVGVTPGGRSPKACTGGSGRVKMSVLVMVHQLMNTKTRMVATAMTYLMADFGMERRNGVRITGVAVACVLAALGKSRSPLRKMGQRI